MPRASLKLSLINKEKIWLFLNCDNKISYTASNNKIKQAR